jgi:radical SAM protein with 4Fe4S-binding SPASM domain
MDKKTYAIEYPDGEYENILLTHAAEKNVPIQGEIEITSKCNFRCIHCYADQEKSSMDPVLFMRIADQLRQSGCIWLLVTGGEPLIHEDFEEMWNYAHGIGLRLSLFTNGSMLTDKKISVLRQAPPENIEVSVYSLSGQTQKIITGNTLDVDTLLSGLRSLKTVSRVVLKTPLLTENIEETDNIEQLAKENGFGFRMDAVIHPSLSGDCSSIRHRVPAAKAASVVMKDPLMREQLRESNSHNRLPFETEGYLFPCSAGKYSFHIDNEANLSMCSIYRNRAGCLKEESFASVWKRLTDLRETKASPNRRCGECKIRSICPTCPAVGKLHNRESDYIDEYICQYTHEIAALSGIRVL